MLRTWTMAPAFLIVMSSAAAEAPDVPVRAFVDLCMSTRGVPDVVRDTALRQGMVVATPEQKARLMRAGGEGDAYAARGLGLVVERGRRMCTVFAKSDDPEATGKELKSWLPPASSGFTVTTEAVGNTPEQSTVMYKIALQGQPFAAWIFSIHRRPGLFNVAMTLQ